MRHTHKQHIFPYQVEFCFWKLLIITTIVCEQTCAKTRNCCVNHLYSVRVQRITGGEELQVPSANQLWPLRYSVNFLQNSLCSTSSHFLSPEPLVMFEVGDFFSWQMWWHRSRDFSCGFHKPACIGLLLTWKLLNGSSTWWMKNELIHFVVIL